MDNGAVERNVEQANEALSRAQARNNSSHQPPIVPETVTGVKGPIMQNPRPTGTHEGGE